MWGRSEGPNKAGQATGKGPAPAESRTAARGATPSEADIWAEPETWACETLMEYQKAAPPNHQAEAATSGWFPL